MLDQNKILKAYEDGFRSGRLWHDRWEHTPGGPYVSQGVYHDQDLAENKAWLRGWHDGNAERSALKNGIIGSCDYCYRNVPVKYDAGHCKHICKDCDINKSIWWDG